MEDPLVGWGLEAEKTGHSIPLSFFGRCEGGRVCYDCCRRRYRKEEMWKRCFMLITGGAFVAQQSGVQLTRGNHAVLVSGK